MVSFGRQAGITASYFIHSYYSELIVDIWCKAQNSRIHTSWVTRMVVPSSRLKSVLFKFHNVIWNGRDWSSQINYAITLDYSQSASEINVVKLY